MSLLVLSYPGSPGQRAVKRLLLLLFTNTLVDQVEQSVQYVCVCVCEANHLFKTLLPHLRLNAEMQNTPR